MDNTPERMFVLAFDTTPEQEEILTALQNIGCKILNVTPNGNGTGLPNTTTSATIATNLTATTIRSNNNGNNDNNADRISTSGFSQEPMEVDDLQQPSILYSSLSSNTNHTGNPINNPTVIHPNISQPSNGIKLTSSSSSSSNGHPYIATMPSEDSQTFSQSTGQDNNGRNLNSIQPLNANILPPSPNSIPPSTNPVTNALHAEPTVKVSPIISTPTKPSSSTEPLPKTMVNGNSTNVSTIPFPIDSNASLHQFIEATIRDLLVKGQLSLLTENSNRTTESPILNPPSQPIPAPLQQNNDSLFPSNTTVAPSIKSHQPQTSTSSRVVTNSLLATPVNPTEAIGKSLLGFLNLTDTPSANLESSRTDDKEVYNQLITAFFDSGDTLVELTSHIAALMFNDLHQDIADHFGQTTTSLSTAADLRERKHVTRSTTTNRSRPMNISSNNLHYLSQEYKDIDTMGSGTTIDRSSSTKRMKRITTNEFTPSQQLAENMRNRMNLN